MLRKGAVMSTAFALIYPLRKYIDEKYAKASPGQGTWLKSCCFKKIVWAEPVLKSALHNFVRQNYTNRAALYSVQLGQWHAPQTRPSMPPQTKPKQQCWGHHMRLDQAWTAICPPPPPISKVKKLHVPPNSIQVKGHDFKGTHPIPAYVTSIAYVMATI